jgi:large repetitive protein
MKKFIIISILVITSCQVFSQTQISFLNSPKLSSISRIIAGDDNSIFLGGSFSGTLPVNSTSYSSDQGDQFVCKMDASGKINWFIQSKATVIDMKYSGDNLYLLCKYNTSVSFLSANKTSGKDNFFVSSITEEGTLNWISGPESNEESIYGDGIELDAKGNVYLLGSFSSLSSSVASLNIGGKLLSKKDDKTSFLAKFDKTGTIQWISQMSGGNSFITGLWTSAICYSDSNHIYVTGYLVGPCTFGSKSLTTKKYKYTDGDLYSSSVFVATYTDNGVCNDVKAFISEASVTQINADAAGNIILAGYFTGNVSDEDYATSYFGTEKVLATIDPSMSGPSEDGYVAKYTSSGQLLWVARSIGNSTDRINSCVVSNDGTIYACGFAHKEMGFSGKTKKSDIIPVSGTTIDEKYKGDIFVVKLSPDGELEWFKSGGGTGTDMAWDIAAGVKSIYVVGSMSGSITFDNISKQISGKYFNGVIIKI